MKMEKEKLIRFERKRAKFKNSNNLNKKEIREYFKEGIQINKGEALLFQLLI